jgi:hypothetical protein
MECLDITLSDESSLVDLYQPVSVNWKTTVPGGPEESPASCLQGYFVRTPCRLYGSPTAKALLLIGPDCKPRSHW